MNDPVLRCIEGKERTDDVLIVYFIGKLEESGEAGLSENRVGGLWRDVIIGKTRVFRSGKARGRQELLHSEVRELYNLGILGLNNGNQI
jgi:hypothetical protein